MTASLSWDRTSRVTRRSRRCSRASLIYRAMPSHSRRATNRCKTVRSLSNSPISSRVQGGHEGGGQDLGGLPAFITGGGGAQQPQQNPGPNGHEQGDRGQDRFGHRRRRRHRGGGYRPDRPEFGGNNPQTAAPQPDEGGDEPRQPD